MCKDAPCFSFPVMAILEPPVPEGTAATRDGATQPTLGSELSQGVPMGPRALEHALFLFHGLPCCVQARATPVSETGPRTCSQALLGRGPRQCSGKLQIMIKSREKEAGLGKVGYSAPVQEVGSQQGHREGPWS